MRPQWSTVAIATTVLDHREVPPPRGYTRTRHHAVHLLPGDLWRPGPDGQPHTVTDVDRHNGHVTLTDHMRDGALTGFGALLQQSPPWFHAAKERLRNSGWQTSILHQTQTGMICPQGMPER